MFMRGVLCTVCGNQVYFILLIKFDQFICCRFLSNGSSFGISNGQVSVVLWESSNLIGTFVCCRFLSNGSSFGISNGQVSVVLWDTRHLSRYQLLDKPEVSRLQKPWLPTTPQERRSYRVWVSWRCKSHGVDPSRRCPCRQENVHTLPKTTPD